MYFQTKIIISKNLSLEKGEDLKNLPKGTIANLKSISTNYINIPDKSIGIKDLKFFIKWVNLKKDFPETFFIFNAENLTLEASNSILKSIEEPSENTEVIFFSKSLEILETIKSRSIIINFTDESIKNSIDNSNAQLFNQDFLNTLKSIEKNAFNLTLKEIFDQFKNITHFKENSKTTHYLNMLILFQKLETLNYKNLNTKRLLETLITYYWN